MTTSDEHPATPREKPAERPKAAEVPGLVPSQRRVAWPCLGIALIFLVSAVELRLQGRVWWCKCGQPVLWWADVHSSHNSQHLADPYSITHISHGLLFYGLFAWLTPRLGAKWRLWLSLAIEAAWEMIENTNFVIERYRAATISLDYFGDSVANSLGDIACCALGWYLARRLGLWWSIAVLVFTELVLLVWIRDNLFLNVLMLFHPFDAVKAWQMGHG